MSLPDVFDPDVRGSCQWTPALLCIAVFVLKASGACQWTPVFLRFVCMYHDTIQWGFMQQQSWRYCHTILYCLTIVLLSPHPTPLATPPNYTGKPLERSTSVQEHLEHKNVIVSRCLGGETSRYREQDLTATLLHGSDTVRAATCGKKEFK
jgi:hypothetical protein